MNIWLIKNGGKENDEEKSKKRYIMGIVVILVIFTLIYYLNSKYNTKTTESFPSASIQKILEEEYVVAVDQYSLHSMINGRKQEIILPTENTTEYYKVTIKDEGYSKDLPIDVDVFFTTDKEKNFLESSCFFITEPKDLSSKKLKFLNMLVFAGNFGSEFTVQDRVYITLKINTVYKKTESIEFDYIHTVVFNLYTLEAEGR